MKELKTSLYILLMSLLPVTTFAQVRPLGNFLQNPQFKWADVELSCPDSLKQRLIQELKTALKGDPLKDYITDNNADYHLVDVDANGEPDIIYYGFAGEEKNHTLVFLGKENGFFKKLDVPGEIIGMERRFPFSPVTFQLMNHPCCEDVDFGYEEYSYTFKGNELFYQLSYRLKFVRGTVFPTSKTGVSGYFTVINQEYNLRSSPEVSAGSNVVAVYPKGTRGIALCKRVNDGEKRDWWFVIIPGNCKPLKTELGSGNYFSCGWMSDRYLDFSGNFGEY
ncbi:MAG: hypothetical protein ACTHLD_09890 [Chitinophaga sp.]